MSNETLVPQDGNRLTSSQIVFFQTICEKLPFLIGIWNVHTRQMNMGAFEDFLGTACPSHAIMGRFMAGVWYGQDKHHFDFTDAAATLDPEYMTVITDWLLDPWWP